MYTAGTSRSERVSLPQSLILEQNTLGPPATGQGPGMEAEATTQDPVVVESDRTPTFMQGRRARALLGRACSNALNPMRRIDVGQSQQG